MDELITKAGETFVTIKLNLLNLLQDKMRLFIFRLSGIADIKTKKESPQLTLQIFIDRHS
jgi:hypothetical protein